MKNALVRHTQNGNISQRENRVKLFFPDLQKILSAVFSGTRKRLKRP